MKAALLIFLALFGVSCQQRAGKETEPRDTPTSGTLPLTADESLRPLVSAAVSVYESRNPRTDIQARYLPETAVVEDFLNRKSRVVVLGRRLSEAEKQQLRKDSLTPEETRFAVDAVALVVHPSSPVSRLSLDDLRRVMMGEATRWSAISETPGGAEDSIRIVFDDGGSGTVRVIREKVTGGIIPPRAFAAGSNPAVLEYVKTHPSALGVIGVNWLSDLDDSTSAENYHAVKMLALEAPPEAGEKGYFQPFPYEISKAKYFLIRDLYVTSWEPYIGLGTGFVHFLAGQDGQRVVEKAGLMPGFNIVRLIEFPPLKEAQKKDEKR